MKLWILSRSNHHWDCAQAFVVRASNEANARRLASLQAGGEGSGAWIDSKKSTCAPLSARGTPEVILRDFFNG